MKLYSAEQNLNKLREANAHLEGQANRQIGVTDQAHYKCVFGVLALEIEPVAPRL